MLKRWLPRDDLTLVRVTAGHFCAGLEIDTTGRMVERMRLLLWRQEAAGVVRKDGGKEPVGRQVWTIAR